MPRYTIELARAIEQIASVEIEADRPRLAEEEALSLANEELMLQWDDGVVISDAEVVSVIVMED